MFKLEPVFVKKGHLSPDMYQKAIENALTGIAASIKVDFDTTTQTWEERPEFRIERKPWQRTIFTRNLIYHFVDAGTRPHRIEPKNPGGMLVFQSGYRAKTKVRVIGSREGGSFGDTVRSTGVNHPGFPGREFDEEIAKKWLKESARTVQRAIDSLP